MHPRPPYQWKSFWLGLLLLGLVGAEWVRTAQSTDTIGYTTGTKAWELSSFQGRVGALWGNYTFSEGPFELSFGVPLPGNEPLFPQAIRFVKAGREQMGQLLIAWWLVMLLLAVPWLAFLGWRWRAIERHRSVEEPADYPG